MCSWWRYLSLRKQSAEFLPPTHICGFISHKQMRNKRAAGVLGSRGALSKPARKRELERAGPVLVGRLNTGRAQLLHAPSMGHAVFIAGICSGNTREDNSETLQFGNEAQNSRFIKIAIDSFIEQMLV